jgi:hypothetical protein
MPKRIPATPAQSPEFCFANELRGENPPTFTTMKKLHAMAGELFALRPWDLMDENQLILVRHPDRDEFCYCSVMGAMGEVFSMHAYIGAEGYRMFRKISDGVETDAAEFLATQNCVYVEFVPKKELDAPDRKLLAALDHPSGKGMAAPIFRALRPGYHPWYVTAEEAGLLAACLRAVIALCSKITRTAKTPYWRKAGAYPLFVPAESSWRIEMIEPVLTPEPPLPPAQIGPEETVSIRSRDYPIRGVVELDYFVSLMAVGKKSERKACTAIVLAVDAGSGIVYKPELANPQASAGDMLARALIDTIRSTGVFPSEVRLRSSRVKSCLAPFADALGLPLRVVPQMPALDEARESLLRHFGG